MPRMWRDKTVEELREEWHALQKKLEQSSDGEGDTINAAIDAIELEIGRRKVPLVSDMDVLYGIDPADTPFEDMSR